MTFRLNVHIYENKRAVHEQDFDGPVELGRQDKGEPEPFKSFLREGRMRLIVARGEENDVGRRHAILEPLPDGRVRLRNGSTGQPIRMQDGHELATGATRELPLPVVFVLGRKTVRIQAASSAPHLLSLPSATLRPFSIASPSSRLSSLGTAGSGEGTMKAMLNWIQGALDVLQAAAGDADFFERAAGAAVEMVDLDSGQLLLLENGEWRPRAIRASRAGAENSVRPPSRRVLARVLADKHTTWEVLSLSGPEQESLAGVEAFIAAPILDRNGEVLGALYGERRRGPVIPTGPITELEAMLVELLARGVAAGLARLEHERAALAERVRFEQFFTRELADQLAQRPNLLQGREAEVTVLFCDVRGFSRITERLGPARALDWLQDVLDALSECVLAEGGVLVDYVGDELMAMWGAPGEQPDHAARACRAALAMLACLPRLNAQWQAILGEPLEVGIGLNTGRAQVGNTGSHHKFKYGALGSTVNLASRVQGLTKQLQCRLLVTRPTHAQFGPNFSARRIGTFQVVNMVEEVEIYELAPLDRPAWPEARAEYEKGLELFEKKQFALAARTLGNWRGQQPDDGPALILLYRAVRCMVEGAPPKHPVCVLTEK
jgi:adenylate cyclase